MMILHDYNDNASNDNDSDDEHGNDDDNTDNRRSEIKGRSFGVIGAPKYRFETDSEQVPRGKGEKDFDEQTNNKSI